MADLSVIEKYPGSFRLDHPDFANVSKITYAKGVITEMQMTPGAVVDYGDNILVGALPIFGAVAKTSINGAPTDFLPLFYHPKKKYWDLIGHDAADFNTEQGYFENAWLSFRIGDEVTVMLEEGIPKRIIGFANGRPRIGEALLRQTTPAFTVWGYNIDDSIWTIDYPASDGFIYGYDLKNYDWVVDSFKGPDGANLGLIKSDKIVDSIIPAGILTDDYQYITVAGYERNAYLIEYYYIIGPALFFRQNFCIGNITGQSIPKERFYLTWGVDRMYVGAFTPELYNQIKSAGSSVSSVAALIQDYVELNPPPISPQWGNVPNTLHLLYNVLGSLHPLARPSWYLRPHNP